MDFSRRAKEKEIIDLRPLTPEENDSAFRLISMVNRRLGGTSVILHHLRRFLKKWEKGRKIRILDLGTGISDIPEAVVLWGKQQGHEIEVTALDLFHEPLKSGRKMSGILPVQASCFAPPFADQTFDYVTASLFFHHLEDEEILKTLETVSKLAKKGIIINDLSRSPLSYIGFWLLTLFTGDPIFRHDGLLSIRRGFRKNDLEEWKQLTGLSFLNIYHHFAGRVALAGEK